MQEERQKPVRTWDVISVEDVKGVDIDLRCFNIYKVVGDGVVEINKGIQKPGDVLFFDVTNAAADFKEQYKDIITEYIVKENRSEKVTNITNGAKHLFELINGSHNIPESYVFRIFEKEINADKVTLRENPASKNNLEEIYYDVTETSDEFKEQYKDIIEQVEADEVIYISKPEFLEEIKGKSM